MTVPNVMVTMVLDRRLRPLDARTYIFLSTQLDVAEFRPIKLTWLAKKVSLSRERAGASVHRLCACGYVKAGKFVGGIRTYRLTLSPPNPEAERRQRPRTT